MENSRDANKGIRRVASDSALFKDYSVGSPGNKGYLRQYIQNIKGNKSPENTGLTRDNSNHIIKTYWKADIGTAYRKGEEANWPKGNDSPEAQRTRVQRSSDWSPGNVEANSGLDKSRRISHSDYSKMTPEQCRSILEHWGRQEEARHRKQKEGILLSLNQNYFVELLKNPRNGFTRWREHIIAQREQYKRIEAKLNQLEDKYKLTRDNLKKEDEETEEKYQKNHFEVMELQASEWRNSETLASIQNDKETLEREQANLETTKYLSDMQTLERRRTEALKTKSNLSLKKQNLLLEKSNLDIDRIELNNGYEQIKKWSELYAKEFSAYQEIVENYNKDTQHYIKARDLLAKDPKTFEGQIRMQVIDLTNTIVETSAPEFQKENSKDRGELTEAQLMEQHEINKKNRDALISQYNNTIPYWINMGKKIANGRSLTTEETKDLRKHMILDASLNYAADKNIMKESLLKSYIFDYIYGFKNISGIRGLVKCGVSITNYEIKDIPAKGGDNRLEKHKNIYNVHRVQKLALDFGKAANLDFETASMFPKLRSWDQAAENLGKIRDEMKDLIASEVSRILPGSDISEFDEWPMGRACKLPYRMEKR